ncbi:hypothetical protein LTR84_012000 [Exophiala bonariae]|uniref:3CxxC-type domain-containing protein n=1 Tax=Exophiala bonariae TaxID=1690606 RepID=A0AAV9MRT9_9EURO|nr:hypothetical protein LTR84_012000 [Exophiala bonariae]
MARKKVAEPKQETRRSFVFPWLHKDVENAVSHSMTCTWVRRSDGDKSANREYTSHVMGKFECVETACSTDGWSGKKVAIRIRGYTNNGYNAIVFNQRCRRCEQLGTFTLDKAAYIERIAYRVQKWAGVQEVEPPYYDEKKGPPHREDLCEGCKKGVCKQKDDWQGTGIPSAKPLVM